MYLFIFSYCCSMFAIIHRSMAWIYNCKCVHLDERRSRWKFFEESNESHNHSIFNSLQMTFKSNNALHIIEKIHVWTWKPKWLYTWTNNRTPSSSITCLFCWFWKLTRLLLKMNLLSWTEHMIHSHNAYREKTTFKKHLRNESINTFYYNCYITNI